MNIALVFAGGTGKRMNSKGTPKQFLELNGKPIIIHTIEHFENHPKIDKIVIVCVEGWISYLNNIIKKNQIKKVCKIVKGGKTGQESIRNGLFWIRDHIKYQQDSIVLIHDGVRPLINERTITDNIDCVKKHGNAITVTSAIETIVKINEVNEIENIEKRSQCRLARAPQSFILSDIIEAHEKALINHTNDMIDSASLMKEYGHKLHIVDGPIENIKITTPSDFFIFKAIIEAKENSQIWGI